MTDQTDRQHRGLYSKYHVERLDGKALKGGQCIVLEVGDPNAWAALRTWADSVDTVGYYPLAADVRHLVNDAEQQHRAASQPAAEHDPTGQPQSPSDDECGTYQFVGYRCHHNHKWGADSNESTPPNVITARRLCEDCIPVYERA